MTDRFKQLRAAMLALLMVTSLFAIANVGAAAPGDPSTYVVKQGGQCHEVTALGDGTQSVSDFYDYRTPNTDPSSNSYSSFGTEHLQQNQVSQLFLYNGSEGVSLVMLHDKMRDGPSASTTTFRLSGLPDSREWIVEDDDYPNRDDEFIHNGTESTIHWKWAKHRNDGAVVRGLEDTGSYSAIQIDPGFNEEAAYWGNQPGDWPYSGDSANRTDAWRLITQPGQNSTSAGQRVDLSMGQNLTIEPGSCGTSDSAPSAALSAQPTTAEENSSVTLDASNSTDDGNIVEYRWDFDGNGSVDAVSSTSQVLERYEQNGTYDATVTVVDDGGNTDNASVTITITDPDDQPPTASLNASPSNVEAGNEVTFDASNSSDNGDVSEYRWDFDGDGSVDNTTSASTTTHTYSQTGTHNATVTVVDTGGNSDTANATVTVSDTTSPTASADVPDQVVKNSTFEVDGSASADNGQIDSYSWDFGDNTTKSGVTASHSYAENGTYNVTLTVTDAAGNSNSATQMVTVTDNDTQSPVAALSAPGSVTVGENVTLDASDSSDDGNIVEYRWDFNGDDSIDANTSSATTQHSYESSDDYNATVTVVDSAGKKDSAMQTISVQKQSSDESPTAAFDAPSSTHVGTNFTVDASASADPDGQIASYEWDFGDGKASVNGKDVTYAYDGTGGGTYTITLTVTDNDGNTDTTSKQISVGDNPPNFGIKTYPSSGTVDAGDKIWVSAEPHGDDDGIVDYHFKWGDGTVTETTNGPPWKGGHVYSSPGTYEVQVTVMDTMGQSVSKNVTLTIADPNAGNGGSGDGDSDDDKNNNNSGNAGGNTGGNTGGDTNDDPKTDVDDSKDGVHVDVDGAKGDEPLTVELPTGTQTGDGLTAYESITVTLVQDGDYDMTLNALEEAPDGVTAPTIESAGFEPLSYLIVDHPELSDDEIADAEFTFSIQQDRLDALDADASAVQIYRYDDGSWATVDTTVVEETDDAVRFRASDGGLSTFVVAIDRPSVGLTDLSVSQDSIAPGESVEITATIENDGRASAVNSVELGVDGETVDTRDVTMEANSERSITFERTFSESGTHTISVNGQEVEIVVQSDETSMSTATPEETPATPDDGQPGFGLVLAALAMLGAALLALRRQ